MSSLNYDKTINSFSEIRNVLFADSAIESLSQYSNSSTLVIGYDSFSTTADVLTFLRSWNASSKLSRIGFAFHYYRGDSTPFMNQQPLFSDSDLLSPAAYSQNVQFVIDLIREFPLTNLDFLACSTLQSDKWKKYYQMLLSQTGGKALIGASTNNTGNLLYGGDWVMESTMENIRDVYFTTAIENYAHLLVADFTVGGVLYRDQGGNKLLAVNFTNSGSLTHLDLPASVTNGGITYSVTSIADGSAGSGFTNGNSTLVSMTFPNTLVTFNSFTFRLGFIREFDLTNTKMVAFPPQFAHGSSAYLLKLPYTCTSLANDSFNNLQNLANSVYWNYPTPIQLTLPDSITTITGTPFHHTVYASGNSYNAWGGRQNNVSLTTQKGIKLGSLIMYDASNNHYKYVGAIPYDILWGTTNTSGTDRGETLNNIIKGFKTSKTNTALWALTVVTSVSFPSSTTLSNKANEVIVSADASNAASVRYSLDSGSTWITNTASPNTSIALPDGTYAINAIKVICTSSDGVDSATFTNSSAITVDLTGPYGLAISYPTSTTPTYRVQSVSITSLPADAVSWKYSINGGNTWTVRDLSSSSFVLPDGVYGVNSIRVTCADSLGNDSAINYNTSIITIDFTGPDAGFVVAFPSSTDSNAVLPIDVGTVYITNLPTDAVSYAYSTDNGVSWTSIVKSGASGQFTLVEGVYPASSVKVLCTDAAGNNSVTKSNSAIITINYQSTLTPTIPTTVTPSGKVNLDSISTLNLTDTAVIGSTVVANRNFTSSMIKSLFSSNTAKNQLVVKQNGILPGFSASLPADVYLFNASSKISNSKKVNFTKNDLVSKNFYIILDDGDAMTMATINHSLTISKSNNTFTMTTSAGVVTTAVVGDIYAYDGLRITLGSIYGSLMPPNVNFVLTALNSSIQLSTSSVIPSYSQSFTADATITLNTSVSASVLQDTFFFRTDTDITTDASFVYFYVDTTKWPNKNTTLSARNGIVTSNGYVSNDTGGKDFLRDLARQLFGTHLGADLFTNEDAVVDDINTNFDTVANNIVTLLSSIDKTTGTFGGMVEDSSGNKYLKDVTSTSNISRELMNELMTAAPDRFADIKLNYKYNSPEEDGFYKIPILAGDTITFKVTICPSTGQTAAVPTGPVSLTNRSYTVILNVSS